MNIIPCENCGKPFKPIRGNQKYCAVCKLSPNMKRELHSVECTVCGTSFNTVLYNKKYCSKKCRDQSKLIETVEVFEKVCGICEKKFRTRRPKKVYCSRLCSQRGKAVKDRAWREKNLKKGVEE